MRFKFKYVPLEDRMLFSLATDELQFACWLTRRQCLTWLRALSGLGCQAPGPARRNSGAGGQAPLGWAEVPVQALQSVTFRTGQEKVIAVFSPLEGENFRFAQGKKIADQVYPTLFSVAERAGWDPGPALNRIVQSGKKPSGSHSLH